MYDEGIIAIIAIIAMILGTYVLINLPKLLKKFIIKPIDKLAQGASDMKNENTGFLQKWYNGMTYGQRLFVWIVSGMLIFIYGVGLIPLSILIYCKLGTSKTGCDSRGQD